MDGEADLVIGSRTLGKAERGALLRSVSIAQVASLTFGNSRKNIDRSAGFDGVHLSLFRQFHVGENMRVQVRFAATNALNDMNYQGPVVNRTSSPGQFIFAAPLREVRLGMKVSF